MVASVQKQIIGTVSHASGRRAEIEIVESRLLFTVYGVQGNIINSGTSTSAYAAGLSVAMIMALPE